MAYHLGIDLGTTYTAAAVWRDGRVEVASLGNRAPTIPSVVYLGADEEILTGDAAERRSLTEPQRVAREFKRRVGDPTPMVVGGTPYSADALMAKLLRWVIASVTEAEGGPPTGIAISHPANWGDYKKDLVRQAIALADLDDVTILTEPEAAAIHYASLERVEPDSVIAVFDLGGGTFDAAVLRKHHDGWEILGEPQGIERLGGVDFDEAVFQHVVAMTDGAVEELDPADATAAAAMTRLRQECVAAKEALSSDTEASIPVLLPNLQTEVRLTRGELEQMVRPALADAITALRRALRSAGVGADDITAVLLVGGSSRIPLVAQLVSSELGRPVAVDAHPKHGIALGAAIVAAERAAVGADALAATVVDDPGPEPTVVAPPPVVAAAATDPSGPAEAGVTAAEAADPGARRRRIGLVAAIVVAAVLAVAGAVVALGGDDGGDGGDATASPGDADAPSGDASATDAPSDGVEPGDADPGDADPGDGVPATPPPTAAPEPEGPFVRLDRVVLDNGRYRTEHTAIGYTPEIAPGALHIHFFLDTTEPVNAGTNGPDPGEWDLTDEPSSFLTSFGPADRGAATRLCSVVATADHGVFDPESGNCVALPS